MRYSTASSISCVLTLIDVCHVFVHMLMAELLLQPQLVCDRERCLLYSALESQLLLRPERQTHTVAPCIDEH